MTKTGKDICAETVPDGTTDGWIRHLEAENERLRARVADLEEQCLRALGERLERNGEKP